MKKIILFLLILSILSCERKKQDLNQAVEKLNSEIIVLKQKNDSLNGELEKAKM
jgi:cell division protein FtsL